ncbi:MAG: AmmeMemoRadiSam system protein A [Firmicutes bacterium]|nr:AmmeMemoRadiSam system protein A [Bacillota bacterium]
MKTIAHAGIYPHPAIVIPAVGGAEQAKVAATYTAMQELARRVKASSADVLVLITPHGPMFRDAIAVLAGDMHTGSLAQFGVPSLTFTYRNDKDLLAAIELEADRAGIRMAGIDKRSAAAYGVSVALDHGATVPLYFLQEAGVRLPLVHITFGLLPPDRLYAFGQAVRKALMRQKRQAALVISADLSHRLKPDAPYGYSEAGREFDGQLVNLLEQYDVQGILKISQELREEAAECGYRSILIGLGILDGDHVRPEVLSYEGPFGVGYLVADLTPASARKDMRPVGSEHVMLAKKALESYVLEGKVIDPPPGSPLGRQRAGAFVSLKINGRLRGCIGTIEPVRPSLAEEIIANAISAGMHDPRFPPVTQKELPLLSYSVDVLAPAEEVAGLEELDPKKYGVIVSCGNRRGVLLPDLEGVETAEEQVRIALEKAGIRPEEEYRLYRFQVERYQ